MTDTLWPVSLFIVGLLLGYRLPDVDVTPILPLRHRSAWTHGPLLALALWWAAGVWPAYAWAFAGGAAALTMHLLEDVNPKKWAGSAMINLFPIPLSLPAPLSALYLGASIVVSAWITVHLLKG